MRPCLCFLLSAVALFLTPRPSAGQASLVIMVVDSASAIPIRRAGIWVGRERFARGDTAGVVRLDSLRAGLHRLSIGCTPALNRRSQGPSRTRDVRVADASLDTLLVTLPSDGCDQRPLQETAVQVRGYLEFGFEHSRFVPCLADRARLPAELQRPNFAENWIWVRVADSVTAPGRRKWPRGETRDGFTRWYAVLAGQLKGPDHYGHLGVGAYLLTVQRLDTLVDARRSRCGG